ncbi:unnamed protein product [Prunus armeniaca]
MIEELGIQELDCFLVSFFFGIELNQSINNPHGIDLALTHAILLNGSCTYKYHKLRIQLNQFWRSCIDNTTLLAPVQEKHLHETGIALISPTNHVMPWMKTFPQAVCGLPGLQNRDRARGAMFYSYMPKDGFEPQTSQDKHTWHVRKKKQPIGNGVVPNTSIVYYDNMKVLVRRKSRGLVLRVEGMCVNT